MKNYIIVIFVALGLMSISPAFAQKKFSLGASVAASLPMGDATKDSPMSDVISLAIPLTIDALYRVKPGLRVGLFGSYGFAMAGKDLEDVDDASVSTMAYGLQTIYSPNPKGGMFYGAKLGMESVNTSVGDTDASISGFMLAGQVFKRVAPKFLAFGEIGIGQYGDVKQSDGDNSLSVDIDSDETALHFWLSIGARFNIL
jgi:hypothetical protein